MLSISIGIVLKASNSIWVGLCLVQQSLWLRMTMFLFVAVNRMLNMLNSWRS